MKNNIAYIDAQNLYMATKSATPPWNIDLKRLRIYLTDKYDVAQAYYYLGSYDERHSKMYKVIQESGYVLIFRKHGKSLVSMKKGNVDTDIVFDIMHKLYVEKHDGKIVLVSNDGDYFKTMEFIHSDGKLEKILHPSKKFASSLYKELSANAFDFLDNPAICKKIEFKKRKAS